MSKKTLFFKAEEAERGYCTLRIPQRTQIISPRLHHCAALVRILRLVVCGPYNIGIFMRQLCLYNIGWKPLFMQPGLGNSSESVYGLLKSHTPATTGAARQIACPLFRSESKSG